MPNLFPITDFADPALDVYARLTENQLVNREDLSQGLFIAESPKVIERALNAGYLEILLVGGFGAAGAWLDRGQKLSDVLDRFFPGSSQDDKDEFKF